MTAVILPAGAPTSRYMKWNSINWKKVNIFVKRLQMRIAKAVKEKMFGKAKSLQWLLTKSYYAKLLAIKASSIHIMRHIKIKCEANPFDPQYKGYFGKRRYFKTYSPHKMPLDNVWQSL